ncbi:hypothetical protein INR49_005504 [Caranx melampygus]|nr:hypothetical protein INR49_005504 [Caranx melampygus]
MDTLSNTALLSNDWRLFGGEKEKQGGMKEEGQSLTRASNGQVQSNKNFTAETFRINSWSGNRTDNPIGIHLHSGNNFQCRHDGVEASKKVM